MIPLKDNAPLRSFPFVTIILIMLNVLFFLLELEQLAFGEQGWETIVRFAAIPALVVNWPRDPWPLLTLITSQFLHGGWVHLGGNMLFLWVFGRKVEGEMGPFSYLGFYLVGGTFSSMLDVIFSHKSSIPSIGASGAIAAVLGAYMYYFPRARVWVWIPVTFWTIFPIPAFLVLGFWFVMQLFNGVLTLDWGASQMGGTAWWAHIGGFVAGLAMCPFLRQPPPRDYRAEYLHSLGKK
jgi:membrane associated rhomboid family serine protease